MQGGERRSIMYLKAHKTIAGRVTLIVLSAHPGWEEMGNLRGNNS